MLDSTLSPDEAGSALATLRRLRRMGLDHAVTGGLAIAWHAARNEPATPSRRPLHDLDLVVADLGSVPGRLSEAFEIRHVHADAPPGRMLVQAFDRSTMLRIDIFGAYGDTLSRCSHASLRGAALRVVSLDDIVARLCALLLDLALGEAVAPKHARDFSSLLPQVDPGAMGVTWREHRRSRHPSAFDDAQALVRDLIGTRPDLLVEPVSPYRISPCHRCRAHPTLKLAT